MFHAGIDKSTDTSLARRYEPVFKKECRAWTDNLKSWNVYNPANIARVKADEAAAAAQEAADEQRMQELDAERRAAILRGRTPPPLPDEEAQGEEKGKRKGDRGRDSDGRKRRRLAGEDDTDRDIRLAKTVTDPEKDDNVAILKLRKPKNDAPLTDHAGNINLFPVDVKEAVRREKNAEAEKEKKKKEQAFEDQYTMRLANAAGKNGLDQQPWYIAANARTGGDQNGQSGDQVAEYQGFGNRDVWGNEDPGRKDRQKARIVSSDPLAFMNQAQAQLRRSKEEKKRWVEERDRELRELRAAEEREDRRHRHGKRSRRREDDDQKLEDRRRDNSLRHRYCKRSRSRSPERRHEHKSSHRHDRKHP
jgi:hypothetical protein